MTNDEMLTPVERLNASFRSFELLKDILGNFTIREQLTMVRAIRDEFLADENILAACDECAALSQKRKELLDNIHEFMKGLIKENTKKREDLSFSQSQIMDPNGAKTSLLLMAEKELSLDMFNETETPPIFANIAACGKHVSTLHCVSDNLRNGKYNILIMGDFQSGKSTTLDAFCDGRHISAIGNGTATSAVLVSVSYAEEESLVVRWRTKEQLGKILDKVKQYLPEYPWNELDLDDACSRGKLKDAIEQLRESKHCPKLGQGDAKFLMLADFILTYYDTDALSEKKALVTTIADIPTMTKFPKDGESTWKESGVSKFNIDDVLFVFVDLVQCFIPSKTLKELNCTIIDSPGLFNSSYDTLVTEGAMVKAHAIMYVLPYHKEMNQDVCCSLYHIRDHYPDVHKKLFVVNNLRKIGGDDIYQANCKKIQDMFGPDKTVYRYDARLSYLTQLKKLCDEGIAKESDYRELMSATVKTFSGKPRILNFKDFNEAWDYHMNEFRYVMDGDECEVILEGCGFLPLVNALGQFIARNESYAVLLSNGLKPMWGELKSIQNSLVKSYIEVYNIDHDELEGKWTERIAKAHEFQTKVTATAKALIYEGVNPLFERIVKEEYEKLFDYDFYRNLAEDISQVLYDNKGELLVTKTLLENKSLFEKRFASIAYPLIADKITTRINWRFQYLNSIMESGQDMTVINLFTPMTDILHLRLQKEWETLFDEDLSMQDYLHIPETLCSSRENEADKGDYDTDTLSGFSIDMTLMGGLVTQITVIVVGLASMIAGYLSAILLDVSGGTFLLSVLLGLGGTAISAFAPEMVRSMFVEILSAKILPKLRAEAVVAFRSLVDIQLRDAVDKYIDSLEVDIQKMENERDLALIPSPHKESLCFRAVEAYSAIDKQIDIYEEYRRTYIDDKTV